MKVKAEIWEHGNIITTQCGIQETLVIRLVVQPLITVWMSYELLAMRSMRSI